MGTTRISFKNEGKKEFSRELKQAVNNYFEKNNLSNHANAQMVAKTIICSPHILERMDFL